SEEGVKGGFCSNENIDSQNLICAPLIPPRFG
ncbi:MAG: hypothetical protein ACI8V5_003141, partial [Limisphaerales bacterium]